MAIGGFNNQGGNLSLGQFEAYVNAGAIHYYVVSDAGPGGGGAIGRHASPSGVSSGPSGGGGRIEGRSGATPDGPGGGSSTSAITAWVKAHYRAETIGGQTVYDLSKPISS